MVPAVVGIQGTVVAKIAVNAVVARQERDRIKLQLHGEVASKQGKVIADCVENGDQLILRVVDQYANADAR